MSFTWPAALLGLAIVPLALVAYLIAQRRRKRYTVRFTNLDLLASVVSESPSWRRHLPPVLTMLAIAALVVAIARPQWSVDVPKEQATVVLATDTSASMQATDVKPDRLSAAREAAKAFSDRLPRRFRLGLVSFNQQSQLVVPPTTDREQVKQALDGLQAQGGTAMGDALENALAGIRNLGQSGQGSGASRSKKDPAAVIVLLSDGKNTGGAAQPVDAARQAHKFGIPVNTVALGTDSGSVDVQDASGLVRSIPVPPDRGTLREVARVSGGRYFAVADAGKLQSVYNSLGSRIGYNREHHEVTAAFAGAGLGLLMLGGTLSLLWFGRLP